MDNNANPFLHSLRLPVKTSPILCKIVIIVHVICLILAWVNGLKFFYKILLTCLIGVSFCIYLRKIRLYKALDGLDSIILDAKDNWQVKMQNGLIYSAELGDYLFVHPWLTIISLKFCQKLQYFIFTPDIVDADTFRRLRVRLRFRESE